MEVPIAELVSHRAFVHPVGAQFAEVRSPEAAGEVEAYIHLRADRIDGTDAPCESREVATELCESVLQSEGVEMPVVESHATAERECSDLV